MKTNHIVTVLSTVLLCTMTNCKSLAELEAPNQLKLKENTTAHLVTTEERGQILLLETPSTIAKKKKPQAAWTCSCGTPSDEKKCEIVTTEGSDRAECRGDCFCGFKKAPVPAETMIVSKKPLITLKRH